MRYTKTHRTYNPQSCTDVGLYIQANRTTVRIATRSCWQGSRERVWVLRDVDGIGIFEDIKITPLPMNVILENYGLTDGNARIGSPIR